VIAHFPPAEEENDWSALAVADGVELRVQAAFRAPDTAGNSPLFKRLAAVRCAFRWVASIMMRSGIAGSPEREPDSEIPAQLGKAESK